MNLLENAYDFINSSLLFYRLSEFDNRKWKVAFINLVQGIELMVKEKIKRTNKYLIYENIDKPKNTISLSLAIERMVNILEFQLDNNDIKNLKKAIEIRNQMMHFEVDLSIFELRAKYSSLFEFVTSFHFRFLEEELHTHIDEEFWIEEAYLMEFFSNEIITYYSEEVHKNFPRDYVESRLIEEYEIDGVGFPRIRFGEEVTNDNFYGPYPARCPECLGGYGDFHVPGCDIERCPKCFGQSIACYCIDYEDDEITE